MLLMLIFTFELFVEISSPIQHFSINSNQIIEHTKQLNFKTSIHQFFQILNWNWSQFSIFSNYWIWFQFKRIFPPKKFKFLNLQNKEEIMGKSLQFIVVSACVMNLFYIVKMMLTQPSQVRKWFIESKTEAYIQEIIGWSYQRTGLRI